MQQQHPKIKLVIVDNHVLFVEGLIAMLAETHIEVVRFTDSQKGLESILSEFTDIDVILLDLNLEKEDGFDIIEALQKRGAHPQIIILTMYDSQRILAKVKTANVAGYVLKNTTKQNLIGAIQTVKAGGQHFDRAIQEPHYLEPEIKYADDFIKKHNLSKREYEVLILLAKSYSTKEIADTLCISEQTVSTYRKYIKSKLKLKSIADIVRYAFVNRLL